MTASAGWSLPGYAIEELVGFGGTGEVWRARDEATGRVVALKRMRPAGGIAERDRLRREAALLAGVSSPHLVRLRTAVTTADGLVLVLDYAAGGSLASLLAARRVLLPGEVVTVADAVAAALRDVHAIGMVHGDVAPSNVLFGYDARPLLSDLGLARLAGTPPGTGGTPGFTDPVVLAGAEPSPGSDVYGLAATCYAALTGAPPVVGETADELLAMWASGRLPARAATRPSVPIPLLDAIERGLTAAPDERPDVAAFAASLRSSCRATRIRLAGASRVVASAPTEVDARADESNVATDVTSVRPGVAAGRDEGGRSGPRTGATPRSPSAAARRLTALARSARSAGRSASGDAASDVLTQRGGRAARPAQQGGRRPAGSRDRTARAPDRAAGDRTAPARRIAVGVAAVFAAVSVLLLCVVGGMWWAGADRQRPPTIAGARTGPAPVPAADNVRSVATPPAGRSSHRVDGPAVGGAHTTVTAEATCARGVGGAVARRDDGARATPAPPTDEPNEAADAPGDRADVMTAVVGALDALRDSAFARADPARLRCAYVPTSAAYHADLRKLRALMAAGERAAGLRLTVRGVDVLAKRGRFVEVAVRDVLPPYRVVDLTGRPVVARGGRGEASWRMVLRRDDERWRIAAVTAEDHS